MNLNESETCTKNFVAIDIPVQNYFSCGKIVFGIMSIKFFAFLSFGSFQIRCIYLQCEPQEMKRYLTLIYQCFLFNSRLKNSLIPSLTIFVDSSLIMFSKKHYNDNILLQIFNRKLSNLFLSMKYYSSRVVRSMLK